MKRERDWRAPAFLGLAVVVAAAVSFYFATPAAQRPRPKASASAVDTPLPPLEPQRLPVPVLDAGPAPSVASSVMAKPPVSPNGPDDKLPDPPLAIASETPPPFDVPDGGCPNGSARATTDGGTGCAYRDADGGLVPNGPWEARVNDKRVERGQWFEGRRQGPWTWFDEEGRKLKVSHYDHDGQLDGPEREFDLQGNLVAERWYSRNSLHGVEIRRMGDRERRTRWYMGRKLSEETVELDAGTPPAP